MKNVATLQFIFCVRSWSTKDAKVDEGVQLFFSFPTNIVLNKVKKMLQNNIYKKSIYYVKFIYSDDFLNIFNIVGLKMFNQDEGKIECAV